MTKEPLSRLEQVDLRSFWESEAGEFTPWLAQEENIALLSHVLGLGEDGLEVEAQEKNVGPFRADILCKNTADSHWVLIENQLEKTDHIHLGQLLTYASGLNAVTIVWIAQRFTDEHRSTMDWLNDITDDRFNFFGLEIELWRIGTSPLAPKFNIVSKPNDWTRSVTSAASKLQREGLTETKQLQFDYWSAFREMVFGSGNHYKPQKAGPQNWTYIAIGRSDFVIMPAVNTQSNKVYVALVLSGNDAKPHFHLLHENKSLHNDSFGEELLWSELPNRKESRILIERDANVWNRDDWLEQHQWILEKVDKMHKTFSQIIKQLNASDYKPENENKANF